MSESAIRAVIKTTLEGVSGIGNVYDYERWSRSFKTWFDLMTKSGAVNGWMIHRESTASQMATLGGKTVERQHTFRISGIYGVNDASASEKTFQGVIDGIFTAFASNLTLGGTAIMHNLIQVDSVTVSQPGEYGDDIYHVADLSLVVTERVTI